VPAPSPTGAGTQANSHQEKQQQAGQSCLPVRTLEADRASVCQVAEKDNILLVNIGAVKVE
jgi:hypothetical protein